MRIIFSVLSGTLTLLAVVGLVGGCSETLAPQDDPTASTHLMTQIQEELVSLPQSIPPDITMGRLHNTILKNFETHHNLNTPLTLDQFIQTYVTAANETLRSLDIDYEVTSKLATAFVNLYHRAHHEHAFNAPVKLIQLTEQAGFLTETDSRMYQLQVLGTSAGNTSDLSAWASEVREASTAYWIETGRITNTGTLGTQGWLKDLFVVASDTAGSIVGGVLGVAAGTALAGPTGTAIGGVLGGSLGAGAFSGLAIAVTTCGCEEN